MPVLPDPAESFLSKGKESARQGLGAGGERLKGALNLRSRGISEYKTLKQKYPQAFDGMSAQETTFKRLQRGYNWEFILPDWEGIEGKLVGLYCQDISFGEYNISQIEISKYGIFKRGYAGFLEIQSIKTTFLCPIPDLVSVYLGLWKSKIMKHGLYFPKSVYSKTGNINLLDRTGQKSKEYVIEGMFPKTFPSHSLSYKNEGVETFDVEFHVDNVELKGS